MKFLLPIAFVFPTIIYSNQFLDATSYPKMTALFFSVVTLLFFFYEKSRFRATLACALAFWCVLLLALIELNGFESLSSILLGYPQRNLGMLNLLICVLTGWIFLNVGVYFFAKVIRAVGTFISLAILVSYTNISDLKFFGQFLYPNPDALNSNIVVPILGFALASWMFLQEPKTKIKTKSWFKAPTKIIGIMLVLAASTVLGNLQFLIYLAVIFFCLTTLNFKGILSGLTTFLPSLVLAVYLLSVSVLAGWLEKVPDPSLQERLALLRIFGKQVLANPISMRLPDSSADLNLNDFYQPQFTQIIDNAHNVWLEIGIHLGYVPMLAFLSFSVFIFGAYSYSYLRLCRNQNCSAEELYIFKTMICLQQLVFVSALITILNPISCWIYATVFSLSIKLIIDIKRRHLVPAEMTFGESISDSDWRISGKGSAGQVKNKSLETVSLIITMTVITAMLTFSILDLQKKVKFREIERSLSLKSGVEYRDAVDRIVNLSLELRDRHYLDYTGRKLLEIGQCTDVERVLATQRDLNLLDLRHRVLMDAYEQFCPNP